VLEELFHAVGYGLCHQLPERSFFSGGYQLPVCARDTGIYLGFALGLLALALLARKSRPTELPRWPVLVLIGLFIAAMGADGVTSYAGLRETTNDLRLVTGLVTGWGLSALTFPMFNSQIWERPGAGRTPDGWREVLAWLGLMVIALAVIRWGLPLLGVVYPMLLVLAILLTLGAVNMVFVGLMPPFERRAVRLRDAWLAMAIATGFTVLEIAAAAWLRAMAERLLL
jgi:uncharacterized membrane protein